MPDSRPPLDAADIPESPDAEPPPHDGAVPIAPANETVLGDLERVTLSTPQTAQPLAREAVEATLAALPTEPGCYLFRDAEDTVLYVGKARSLRDRVRSYFRNPGSLSLKNRGLVPKIASIDYQRVPTENAALLLEFNLIKQYRPRYNILLRDDKSYLAIRITNEPYPRIEAVRRRSDDGARYFGPYTSAQSVYRTLDLLKRLFPYRSCRLNIVPPGTAKGAEAATLLAAPTRQRRGAGARRARERADTNAGSSRKPPQERILTMASPQNRACLEYHIHRCSAPCIDAVSQEDYAKVIEQAALFLQGRGEQVLGQLQRAMEAAAEDLDFERAARLRDQIEAVRKITERQRVTILGGHDQDIVGLARAGDEACVELIAVREGRMLGHKQFILQGTADQEDATVLGAFLKQYYITTSEVPEEVLLPADPEDAEAIGVLLSGQRGRRVTLTVPRRGDKLALVEVAQQNVREIAEQRKLKWLSDSQKTTSALSELQAALKLPRLPIRIECFDISNIQGTSAVGSMVVFENGKPKTADYRRFRIKSVQGSDDFAMMAEMLRRRLKRAEAGAAMPQDAPTPLASTQNPDHTGPLDAAATPPDPDQHTADLLTTPAHSGTSVPLAGPSAPASDIVEEPASELSTSSSRPQSEAGPSAAIEFAHTARQTTQSEVPQSEAAQSEAQPPTDDQEGVPWRRPDLIIVDGGKGQLNAVLAVLADLHIDDQPIVGLAKQQEELFLPGRSDSILLPRNSQALFLVQRVRDEAHRFAITYHRAVRGKRSLESSLDSVPGVGGRRKRDLLRHFGTVSALRKASLEEIAALSGIGPKTALAIKEHLGEA